MQTQCDKEFSVGADLCDMHRMDSHGPVMPTEYTNLNTKGSHKGHSQE